MANVCHSKFYMSISLHKLFATKKKYPILCISVHLLYDQNTSLRDSKKSKKLTKKREIWEKTSHIESNEWVYLYYYGLYSPVTKLFWIVEDSWCLYIWTPNNSWLTIDMTTYRDEWMLGIILSPPSSQIWLARFISICDGFSDHLF